MLPNNLALILACFAKICEQAKDPNFYIDPSEGKPLLSAGLKSTDEAIRSLALKAQENLVDAGRSEYLDDDGAATQTSTNYSMAKNQVRVQHFVPQFYLRRFAIPGFTDRKKAKIWLMDSASGEVFTKKAGNIAAVDYLYSHKKANGTRSFEVEAKLSELEDLIARFYDRFVDGVPDLAQSWGMKKFLSLFLATLMTRHPDEEEKNRQIHASMVEQLEQMPKDQDGIPLIDSFVHKGKQYPFDPSGYHEYAAADANRLEEAFAAQIIPVAESIVDDLFAKRWVIFCADQPVFFTSDRPVQMFHTELRKFGTGTPGTQIIFPISPKRLLWMMDREGDAPDGFYPLPGHEASGLNVISMSSAPRYVLSHEQPDGMFAGVNKIIDEEWRRFQVEGKLSCIT